MNDPIPRPQIGQRFHDLDGAHDWYYDGENWTMIEALPPQRAVRLLRAKAHELENTTKVFYDVGGMATNEMIGNLAADIALVAQLLADHIERTEGVP